MTTGPEATEMYTHLSSGAEEMRADDSDDGAMIVGVTVAWPGTCGQARPVDILTEWASADRATNTVHREATKTRSATRSQAAAQTALRRSRSRWCRGICKRPLPGSGLIGGRVASMMPPPTMPLPQRSELAVRPLEKNLTPNISNCARVVNMIGTS